MSGARPNVTPTSSSAPSHVSKTLLVPLDGSNEAGAAFDYAVKNTSKDDTIVLFHGEPQVFHLTGTGGMVVVVENDQTASRNTRTLQAAYLDKCARLNRHCEWVTKSFVGGSSAVAHDIVKTAQERKAEAIIMGARGLSALGSVMLGSVSQAVLQRAAIPVTVVKLPRTYDGESWKQEQHTL